MTVETINRQQILDNAELEDELSNLKQHADKMLRGFENFNNFSSNRAIWELVQNACDLSKECKVLVDYRNSGFSFSHNGKPFTTNSLISLIKQVSGKYGESEDIPEVGKYGTGFLTTHTLGRKFQIDSYLEAGSAYFRINDFLIDRSPKEWKELSNKIRIQKNEVYRIIREDSVVDKPEIFNTTFSYLPNTEQEFKYIADSLLDLEEYAPIVLTINERLKEFVIIDKSSNRIEFKRQLKESVPNEAQMPLFRTVIHKDGVEKIYYSLIDSEDEIEIILPINEKLETFTFGSRVARLFLYYPLVGSEHFGINFIVNCQKFLPTEPRDGIHLQSNKDQVQEQEKENRRIIEKASNLIFDFLKSNVLKASNPLLFSVINFKRDSDNTMLNDYFNSLQLKWTEEFRMFPFVETINGFKPISECVFFDAELIGNEGVFDEIYEIASLFYENLPVKNDILLWSEFTGEWNNENLKFISHDDLIKNISENNLTTFTKETLKNYYQSLINDDNKSYFSDFALLPNIDGNFLELNHLLVPEYITDELLSIGRTLIPKTIERFIHPDFKFNFSFENFNRKHYSNKVKEVLDEKELINGICLPKGYDPGLYTKEFDNSFNLVDYDFFMSLIQYCKLNPNVDSQSKPSQLVRTISEYYGQNSPFIYLNSLTNKEDNLDVRSSRKILVQIFFNLLVYHTNEWVSAHLEYLHNICDCKEDSLKEIYAVAQIYPNQLNKLCGINNLKRDIDLTDEITTLYDKVLKTEIKSQVTYSDFNQFIAEDQFINNKYLTTQIEEVFFEYDINNINEHPFKEDILKIIAKLREPYYSNLFPRLDDKKANLMLEVVTNENTKDDIFSIVTLREDQIKKLGALVKEANFESLLNRAASILEQEKENTADFRHKYEIGTNIERLIRSKLTSELQERVTFKNEKELEAKDIQGGQDIVIMIDNEPFYLIEVKSRWKSENSISMSKLQLQRAVEENGRYALCSVDISKYEGTNNRYKLSIDEIIPLTKFVKKIGTQIEPLIQANLIAEKSPDESIRLIEYRGIIPQDTIKVGESFSDFTNSLCLKINSLQHESKPN